MALVDTVNRLFREFKRYTGDGLAGEPTGAPLPIGDPQSGPHSPKKSELRAGFTDILGGVEGLVGETTANADRAEAAADRADAVAAGVEYPVSFASQVLSAGEQAQARENIHALPDGQSFQTTVSVSGGMDAAWELTTTPVGSAKDGLLINHILDAPSNGLHILGTVLTGVSGGQSMGAAMNGPGTANAVVGNRYESGGGHGVEGNRVGSGSGYGVHAICSSTGGAVRAMSALKQNDTGVPSGTAGVGPAVEISNISNEGMALQTFTSGNNVSAISNEFTRGNGAGGVIADFKTSDSTTRTSAAIGQRIIMQPGAAWGGSPAVIGQEITIGANATGSVETRGLLVQNYSVGNTTSYGVFSSTIGANGTNYGGYFQADGATNNVALRADGNVVITGSISKGSGTFLIDHPLDPFNKDLAHGFVEAPRYDLIYRGTAKLVGGRAKIDIDAASDMTGGTFAALTFNAVVTSLQNQDGFARLRPGKIDGGGFEIICEDQTCTDLVSWVVIAERNDSFVKSDLDPNTNSDGRFVPERYKEE